ncbi:hypothetical protein QAD02_009137 [Eretmocerus hayati]|uniref:Uncharacterized protein n=1 Tax=Eretmocerus hayati TaxID=131215 RepID=A0ACC2NAX5_9HYME|nr:hypothetical protein QAD02_009137 [Eretmocerus hayati]
MHIKLKSFVETIAKLFREGKSAVGKLNAHFLESSRAPFSGVRVLDDCVGDIAKRGMIRFERGVVYVGDSTTMGEFVRLMKRADLGALVKISNPAQKVTAREIKSLELMVEQTPDLHLKHVDEFRARAKTVHPDLDVPALESVSPGSLKKVKDIESKFAKKYAGTTIKCTFGAISLVAGTAWLVDYMK